MQISAHNIKRQLNQSDALRWKQCMKATELLDERIQKARRGKSAPNAS